MSQALYRIGTLAKLSGLSTHAIRVWERRYGAAAPSRTAGGARLYSDDDVRRFKLMKQLLARGYATRAIASLSLVELSELASPEAGSASAALDTGSDQRARAVIEELIEAVTELKLEAAERVLLRAANDFSPRDLVTNVLAPALAEIGARWASGALCTASEHAASAMLRTRLGGMLAAQPVGNAPPIVCTTPAGEQHELGALLVAVLIAMRGRRAVFLGANLPAEQIAEAVRMSRANGVALSLVGLGASDARRELTRIAKALPATVGIVVGGRGAASLGKLPERVHLLAAPADLERWLDAQPK